MPTKKPSEAADVMLAGFTVEQWKQHMDQDEDWTERIEGADAASVRGIVEALAHANADVRLLACNLIYALGADGLGAQGDVAVTRLAELAANEPKVKLRTRARLVHEAVAQAQQRAAIHREFPWLGDSSGDAAAQALAALDDARARVRLHVYLWWVNAAKPATASRTAAAQKLAGLVERESEPELRQAASLALARVRG